MAKALGGIESLSDLPPLVRSLRSVWMLRLALGLTALLGAVLFFIGTSWDIQWHSFIGRDRTLIPPHLMMLSGVAISGVAALTTILIETLWARRSPTVAKSSTPFAETFHGSLGAYIAGFAALDAAVAFPLDSYWHSLYGIDVAIWAPFHVMFVTGMAIVALGATYMLASAAHLAESEGAPGAKRVAYMGAIVAFATMMSIFTFLLFDALGDRGYIDLGFMTVNVFSVLAALLGMWTLVAAVYAVPWRWAATSVAVVYLFFALIVEGFVPPATDTLVALEHLAYRHRHPPFAIVAVEWPLAPILAAIVIDVVIWLARRRGWSLRRLTITMAIPALIGFVPVLFIEPLYVLGLFQGVGAVSFGVWLLLGWLGSFVGTWFGRRMGKSMQHVDEFGLRVGEAVPA